MFQNIWFVAAMWMGLALFASLISIWSGISVALIEILVGVLAGNFLHLHASNEWINFLALLGSGVLTFLAGAEIDPRSLKANLRASMLIGVLSFAIPFGVIWLFAQFILGWPLHQAQIAGIALSTTSVAVVYAVMIEGGFSDTAMGKMILAACFITDFGTVLALGGLFANFNIWLLVFVVIMCAVLWFMPAWTKGIIDKLGATRVSEPEVKFIFFILFFLGGLATTAKSEAVLPAYLVGLVVAGVFFARQNSRAQNAQHRIRDLHPVLFHQSRTLRFATGALAGARDCRRFSSFKNGDEDRWRLAPGADALHESTPGCIHDAPHGDRADFRHNLGAVWISK
jgi:Kef-type K+ transport system membrane component KefB